MPTPADLGTDSESSATVGLADSAIRLDRDPCGSEVFDLLQRARKADNDARVASWTMQQANTGRGVRSALLGTPARTT
jgi:hypothetical protein